MCLSDLLIRVIAALDCLSVSVVGVSCWMMESEIFQRAVRVMKRWCATQIQFKLYRKLQILQDIRSSLLDKSMYNQLMMTMNSLNVFDLYQQLYFVCITSVSNYTLSY